MIVETGRVVAVEKDCVWVETIRKSSCDSCSAQKACGHGLLNSVGAGGDNDEGEAYNRRRNHLRVLLGDASPEQFAVNEVVRVSIPERTLVNGALLVYILPLLTMLLLAALADHFSLADGWVFAAAATGLALGFALVRIQAWLTRDNEASQPRVLANTDVAVQCIVPH